MLSLYFGQRLFTYLELQDFDSDGFERSDLLWAAVRVLDAQFKWRFPIVGDDMSLGFQVKNFSHLPREGSISSIAEKSKAFSTDCWVMLFPWFANPPSVSFISSIWLG